MKPKSSKLLSKLANLCPKGQPIDAEAFYRTYGVKVKQEGPYYLFKYDPIVANWDKSLTRECRGHIVTYTEDKGWFFVSRPFDKFFNQHEDKCPIKSPKSFARRCDTLQFMEKADGTCIQVWRDLEGKVRVSTLGKISTDFVEDTGVTFEQLFREVASKHYGVDEIAPPTGQTWLFELCCPENRILTRYLRPRIYTLGVRDTATGIWEQRFGQPVFDKPIAIGFPALGIDSLEKAQEYVEHIAKTGPVAIYGEYPEGQVIYDSTGPIAKLKSTEYLRIHFSVGCGDSKCTRNKIVESFLDGHLDDLTPFLNDRAKQFAEDIKAKLRGDFLVLEETQKAFVDKIFPSGKEFAQKVFAEVPSLYRDFFFRQKIVEGVELRFKPFTSEDVLAYIQQSVTQTPKFKEYLKDESV